MNFNGGTTNSELADGGTITGDLDIIGDLDVSGELVINTFTANSGVIINTLEVGTLVSDIQVEDPIILVGKDNPSNLLNLGIVEEFNDGAIKYSGILRSKDDNEHYILESLSTLPNGSTDITSLSKGNLNCFRSSATEFKLPNWTMKQSGNAMTFNNSVGDLVMGLDQFGLVDIGQVGTNYRLPATRGTLNQVLKSNGGDLALWEDDNKFDTLSVISTNGSLTIDPDNVIQSILTTSDNNPAFGTVSQLIKTRGTPSVPLAVLSGDILTRQSSSGYNGSSLTAGGQFLFEATEDHTISASGTRLKIQTTDDGSALSTDKITCDSSGVTVNGGTNSITLPTVRGTTGNVLKTNATTGLSYWEDSYNQSLQTSDAVEFKSTTHGIFKTEDVGNVLKFTNSLYDVGRLRILPDGFHIWERSDNTNGGVSTRNYKSRGSLTTPTATLNSDRISRFGAYAHDGVSFYEGVVIECDTSQNWTPTAHGAEYCISTTDDDTIVQTRKLLLDTSGFNIGANANGYRLPYSRGTDGQILKTDGVGVATWQEMYDQDLNTSNFVDFREIGLNSTSDQGSMTLNPEGTWQTLKSCSLGSKGNVEMSLKTRGTHVAPTAVLSGDNIYNNVSMGYDGSGYKNSHGIIVKATENFSPVGSGSLMQFETVDNGSVSRIRKLLIDSSGVTINDLANSITFPSVRGNDKEVLITDGSGVLSWVGSSYGFQYFSDNAILTVIGVVSTFTSVLGTRSSGLLQNFTAGAGGLTYTGVPTKINKITFSCTWSLDTGAPDQCELAIFLNGVIVSGTKQRGALDDGATFPRNCSTNTIISLDTNDVIDIRVANTTDTTSILVSNFSLSVSSV